MSDEKKIDDMATVVGGGLTVDALKKAAAEKATAALDASNKVPVKEEKPQAAWQEDPTNAFTQSQPSAPKAEEPKKGFFAKIMSWLFG